MLSLELHDLTSRVIMVNLTLPQPLNGYKKLFIIARNSHIFFILGNRQG